ncbi:MAG: hypothetical protein RIR48_2832 [Bacteroidota bacterium]|jgi:hypothetical protein
MNNKIFFAVVAVNILGLASFFYLLKKRDSVSEQIYVENVQIKRELDSMKQEVFINQINLGRYEYMMSIVETENPELYKKVMHETE